MEIFLFSVVILGPAVWSIALTSHRITRTIRCNHSLVFIHSSSICLLMNCQVARIPQVENMVQWSFLEPWRAVLRGNAIQRSNDTARSVLRVAIFFEENNAIDQTIYLKVPPDATKQQQLREAMELFTVLSFMDNKAFIELATRSTATQTTKIRADCFWFPKWELQLYDSTSYAGGDQTRATWGTLLGFSDEYSREFQEAIAKLEAMGLEDSIKSYSQNTFLIRWAFALKAAEVIGRQISDTLLSPTLLSLRGQFRGLFDIDVPPIGQLWVSRGLADTWNALSNETASSCNVVIAQRLRWSQPAIRDLPAALARTSTSHFSLNLGIDTVNSRQKVVNAGNKQQPDISRYDSTGIWQLNLSSGFVCDRMLVSVCSAVAEVTAEANLAVCRLGLKGVMRWQWLAYALCGGVSDVQVPSVSIIWETLTKSELTAIPAVLQTKYPLPILESAQTGHYEYGFVDIEQGTELHLGEVNDDDEDSTFLIFRTCRYRALYVHTNGRWVDVVVPGYGVCEVKPGNGVRFTPASGKADFRRKRFCGELSMEYVTFESAAVLMDLLSLVTCGLHSLTLRAHEDFAATFAIDIDLCALSVACPELQELSIAIFNVVISAHSESLCRWPIKALYLESPVLLSDLARCLRNPQLRMARELVCLDVSPRQNEVFPQEEVDELKTHDGEFLPATKEKLPARSKAAFVSVATRASSAMKPIYRLDAFILVLIFVFASTPQQRSVDCRSEW
ncbi:hypothetical protein PHYSODRAFT_302822 [Phytophthora sojae]|uniref:Uncharacterized protein n=1 Tax=Phytophthora sojae (strain P6497) TaxID=1094619 RepID=G4ZSX4_PHYSP|nr:hypothetical protein PHYSODRAFT_302822 [Phytophthora sojae]EGZ13059.1 hypothetical protein PHYSODRAFT_302822 [Phytophthora sojae]|eukprot:XP_009530488.1 hypothetical protein PHYSODRAFT_302822 [Phytophthora sojae]